MSRPGNTFRRSRSRPGRNVRRQFVECLENRLLLDAAGIAWDSAPDLTISFAADGTTIAGYESSFASQPLAVEQTDSWHDTITRAFRTWAQLTNAKITVVTDSGDEFGTPGPTQGDTRFGDIRVGSLPLSADIIAMSIPHNEIMSGTWAGDVLFNSNIAIESLDDLFSVALHEAGHVFGLGHSTDPLSPMFSHGISTAIQPTAHDIADLQELYGLKIESESDESESGETDIEAESATDDDDDYDQDGRTNGQLASADALPVQPGFTQATRYEAAGTIHDSSDVDFFELVPSVLDIEDREYLTVTIRSSGQGLIPKATLFDDEGRELETQVLANSSGLLVLQAKDTEPSDRQFVKIEAALGNSTFQSGDYTMVAQFVGSESKLDKLASGAIDADSSLQAAVLSIPQTQLVHLTLNATAKSEDGGPVLVWATIRDPAGDLVYRIATPLDETRSAPTILLQPGEYSVEFRASRIDGQILPEIDYELSGRGVTIPAGPQIIDPTETPVTPCLDQPAGTACQATGIVITDPVTLPTEPVVVTSTPWQSADWWYWSASVPTSTPTVYHNVSNAGDVNGDQVVSPLDALLVVNYLNTVFGRTSDFFLDVNNDKIVSSIDALLIINQLNHPTQTAGEGEAANPNAPIVVSAKANDSNVSQAAVESDASSSNSGFATTNVAVENTAVGNALAQQRLFRQDAVDQAMRELAAPRAANIAMDEILAAATGE